MEKENELLKSMHILTQPTRQKIIQILREEPLYIEEIAEKIGEDRRNVSFHLVTLAENGFVDGEYRVIKAPKGNPGFGKAGKFYKLTDKVDKTLDEIATRLK